MPSGWSHCVFCVGHMSPFAVWVDAAAALTFFVVKVATLAWARHWKCADVAEHGLEDAHSDSERAAMAAGHGCLLALHLPVACFRSFRIRFASCMLPTPKPLCMLCDRVALIIPGGTAPSP